MDTLSTRQAQKWTQGPQMWVNACPYRSGEILSAARNYAVTLAFAGKQPLKGGVRCEAEQLDIFGLDRRACAGFPFVIGRFQNPETVGHAIEAVTGLFSG